MIQYLKKDFPASIVVFLLALPLCLGATIASGTPVSSGILSGIIGGILVGLLSGSHVSVSGPSPGLIAIVFAAINQLVSFEIFLVAVLLAGIFQIIFGFSRLGFIANYIPSNVVKGLLAGIGIILILKQIPHALGFDDTIEGDFSFEQNNGENTFSQLLNLNNFISYGAILISALSFLILLYWQKIKFFQKIKFLPPSLLVVVLGVGLNEVFYFYLPDFYLNKNHLVSIPVFNTIEDLFIFPDFDYIFSFKLWKVAFSLAIIASLETLFNLEAVENLDPKKRTTSPNRELVAQGIGNIFAGLLGAFPVTSVVIRGSINIHSGAQSKLSTILHGIFLLLSLFLLTPVLNLIPLASLAAILIFTGYKLASVKLFKEMIGKGRSQFVPFAGTILGILFTDLLIGILIGAAIGIFYVLKSNYKAPFSLQRQKNILSDIIHVELPSQVSFLNKASIKEALFRIPENSKVVIDATASHFIEEDVLEILHDFENVVAPEKKIRLNMIGLKEDHKLKDKTEFVTVVSKEMQQQLSPDEVIDLLKEGNERFLGGTMHKKNLRLQADATVQGQNPFAVVLSCIDSRTTTEHIFDLGLGDIFSVRIAGNILNEDILGSMEFGVKVMGVRLVLVLGHTRCGAVAGACNQVEMGNLTGLLEKIQPAIRLEKTETERNGNNYVFVDKVAIQNVHWVIREIRQKSPIIETAEKEGAIKIVGGMYDLATGKVDFFEVQ